jgi:hypothetical protein
MSDSEADNHQGVHDTIVDPTILLQQVQWLIEDALTHEEFEEALEQRRRPPLRHSRCLDPLGRIITTEERRVPESIPELGRVFEYLFHKRSFIGYPEDYQETEFVHTLKTSISVWSHLLFRAPPMVMLFARNAVLQTYMPLHADHKEDGNLLDKLLNSLNPEYCFQMNEGAIHMYLRPMIQQLKCNVPLKRREEYLAITARRLYPLFYMDPDVSLRLLMHQSLDYMQQVMIMRFIFEVNHPLQTMLKDYFNFDFEIHAEYPVPFGDGDDSYGEGLKAHIMLQDMTSKRNILPIVFLKRDELKDRMAFSGSYPHFGNQIRSHFRNNITRTIMFTDFINAVVIRPDYRMCKKWPLRLRVSGRFPYEYLEMKNPCTGGTSIMMCIAALIMEFYSLPVNTHADNVILKVFHERNWRIDEFGVDENAIVSD